MSPKKQSCPVKPGRSGGFTLLEILLVIGIIAILAGIVIVALNPGKMLANARNTERKSDLKQINNALQQYYIDHQEYPPTLRSSLTEICKTDGVASSSVVSVYGENYCNSLVDLSVLVPVYLTAIPVDPQASTNSGAGYTVIKYSSSGKIGLSAPAELGQTITVNIPPEAVMSNYSVTYYGNGSDGGTLPTDTTSYQTGNTINVSANTLTRTGYTFTDWNTQSNGSGTSHSASTSYAMGSANVDLYAQWSANSYTLAFDSSGGSAVSAITQNYNTIITPPAPTKTGYTLTGWSPAIPATMPANNSTSTAQWSINSYTVTFSGNGSDGGATSTQSYNYNQTANLNANTFTKSLYSFSGWATSTNGAVAYANQASYTMGSANVTLYAQWTLSATAPAAPTIGTATAGNATSSVTFTANGNGGSPITYFTVTSNPGSIKASGASSPITVTGLTNGTGYTFTVTATNIVGTSTASGATNPAVTPNAPFSAMGGTITYTDSNGLNPRSSPPYTGGYVVHTFTSGGNFNVTSGGSVQHLIIGGGGGGAGGAGCTQPCSGGGGGGAGGYIYGTTTVTAQLYSVVVGTGGGSGGSQAPGVQGNPSSFNGFTATGGGYGSPGVGSAAAGGSGGSGGGGGGGGAGGSNTAGQGYSGGNSVGRPAGSGGGAGAAGTVVNEGPGSDGGIGLSNSISGSAVYYAGGGGSGGIYNGTTGGNGGQGGGGAGGSGSGTDGAANTGGGGGGGAYYYGNYGLIGGAGGSGIVIIRYAY